MAKTPKKKADARSIRSYLILSAVASVFVGVLVYGGTRSFERTAVWVGLTFIITLVAIATLALSVKDDDADPNKPRLK
jgi:hypothetical protein